jgi:glycosyltransferase involved in cell wall biosynthesis
MTLICPSQWLADLFLQSYLSCYPIKVIKNTIDQGVFKPRRSDFRIKYNVESDKIILAVAGFWEAPTKGFDDILKLSTLLRDDEKIVVVGLTDRLLKNLPQNIIGIRRTNNAEELAEIYSAANVFYNPTKLDNFPTVNLEARACECPVVTYDSGGCKETVEGYNKAIVLYGDQKTPEGFLNAARTAGYL